MPYEVLYPLIVILLFAALVKVLTRFVYIPRSTSTGHFPGGVAVVDKTSFFRKGISMVLTRAGFEVRFEASNTFEMIDFLKSKNLPDIVLISASLDGMNGLESVEWLQQYYPGIKILVMFMDPLRESPEDMIRAGAHGSLAKTADPDEIKNAILEILNKGTYRLQKKDVYRTLNTFWSSLPICCFLIM